MKLKTILLLILVDVLLLTSCQKELLTTTLEKTTAFEVKKDKYHDKEVYHWLKNMQQANGLLETHENSNLISLYDNALAAIIFSYYGDFQRAEKIFDFFYNHLDDEFNNGLGGFSQFRDKSGVPINNKPHRWLGDNAWLLIALNNYHELTNNQEYNKLTNELTSWIRSLQNEDGSLFGGFDGDNHKIPIVTEGMLDAFNAVKGYDIFHKGILKYIKENRYNEKDNILLTLKGDQYQNALDLHSWGFLIFEDFPGILLEKADMFKTTIDEVTGYCFDIDKDTIWIEGTMQMAVAFQQIIDSRAMSLIVDVDKFFSDDLGGLPYVSNIGTGFGNQLIWDSAFTKASVSSSVWYLFAVNEVNPFEIEFHKNIPDNDKFYL